MAKGSFIYPHHGMAEALAAKVQIACSVTQRRIYLMQRLSSDINTGMSYQAGWGRGPRHAEALRNCWEATLGEE